MGLTALGLGICGAFAGIKAATWSVCRRRRPQLEQLANRLAELAAKSRWSSEL